MFKINKFNNKSKGFTLPELLVVSAIAVLLISVVIWDYSSFNDNLAVSSAAQEVSLAIREAQAYAVNVRETSQTGGDFASSYGIYLSSSNGQNDSYFVFVDNNPKNGQYDVGEQKTNTYVIRDGVKVDSFNGITDNCPVNLFAKSVHITFNRPSTIANIKYLNAGGAQVCAGIRDVQIVLMSPRSNDARVVTNFNGQVSVK